MYVGIRTESSPGIPSKVGVNHSSPRILPQVGVIPDRTGYCQIGDLYSFGARNLPRADIGIRGQLAEEVTAPLKPVLHQALLLRTHR